MEIRRVGADEWGELRDLRLRALRDAPDAFTATYEEDALLPDARWIEWATDLAEGGSSFGLVAEREGRWIGMAVGGPHRDHIGEAGLFAMWVDPSARGSGVARALVEGVVTWARSAGFPVIRLRVTQSNGAAVRLYTRCGFSDAGRRVPLREGSDVVTMSMIMDLSGSEESDRLVAEQIRYYDDRASEYEDLWFRRGRYDMGPEFNEGWFRETALVETAVDAFDASGSVLELACGSGIWTRRLAPRARRLVAVDSSASMIELNGGRFGAANVEYVHADVFAWEPGERFDAALTGFFISHIPPDRFARFWERLATWLQPNGRLFLVEDAAAPGRPYSGDVVEDGPAFAHRRSLADGREYTIVKRFFVPEELTATLEALGWDADIRSSGEHLVYGTTWPR